jgi:hypothetical protein
MGAAVSISERLLPGVPVVESMLFDASIDDLDLTPAEREIAVQLHENGFAILDFPDAGLDARCERIRADLEPRFDLKRWRKKWDRENAGPRLQDAWSFNDDVRAIACNEQVMSLLSRIYGRRAFPFQTLNFPVGTQQPFHSDSVHFSSTPERFMCGVWLALEDIDPASGPLIYYPGSHRWPILYNDMLGLRVGDARPARAQTAYEEIWTAMVEASGVQPQTFCPRKGQALIWAANLLHGGSRQASADHSRWSQVTHYYFADCAYYTPAFSDPMIGNLALRTITDISTGQIVPNVYVDQPMEAPPRSTRRTSWFPRGMKGSA